MSEFSMMTSGVPWWMSFPVLIACMGLVGAGMVLVLRRMA